MQDIEKIYKEYFETVNKYLFCLTRNSDISEELTQETFYKAVKKINTYKGECKMSVWLCQIAKNLWIDQCLSSFGSERRGDSVRNFWTHRCCHEIPFRRD